MDVRALFEQISGLRENLHKYLEAKISYFGLVALEKAVRLLTTFIGNALIITIFIIALLFFSVAAALYLGSLLESYELGLIIMGGFFLLIAIILLSFREKIFGRCIIRSIKNVFVNEDDEKSKS